MKAFQLHSEEYKTFEVTSGAEGVTVSIVFGGTC